ncbi:MAG: RNA polymerase sigma factor [Chitinophagaceae bacterium]|nr:RNA polymerase sigma factor [Chitinophagaceae bacterium]
MLTENAKIAALLNGCRNNDRNSQKELYYILRGFAMKICYRYTNHTEESEEIMNEAFVKLYKKLDQFDEFRQEDSLLSLKGWFKRILVNTCIDHYRKNRSSVNGHILSEESDKLPDHSENGLDVLSYKEIINAIKLLSPAYRTVFNLFVIEGLSHEEISKKLGISVGASKSNLSKARDNLRKLLLSKSHFNLYASPF